MPRILFEENYSSGIVLQSKKEVALFAVDDSVVTFGTSGKNQSSLISPNFQLKQTQLNHSEN